MTFGIQHDISKPHVPVYYVEKVQMRLTQHVQLISNNGHLPASKTAKSLVCKTAADHV